MTYRNYLLVLVFGVLFTGNECWAKDDDKSNKIVEQEEHDYKKNLKKHPEDAKTYWDHANKLAAIKTECLRAKEFYILALQKDSTNVAIYGDYGKYLFERLRTPDSAKVILDKGLKLDANDEEIKKCLASVNRSVDAREKEAGLLNYGQLRIKIHDSLGNYKYLSKFDSLEKVVSDSLNENYYQKLLGRFLANDNSLTPEQMYFMIIGYSRQASYTPFNINDILSVEMRTSVSPDSAIAMGKIVEKSNPLHPTLNREMMYCYRVKGDTVMANNYRNRIRQYFSGVIYSGNGTCKNPYIYLWGKEENKFIEYIGYKPTQVKSMETCAGHMAEMKEVIDPATNKKDLIYFNLELIYLKEVGK